MINTSNAQTPEMDEQFVYGIHLSNGKGYTSSFCPQSQNTIYIIANTENVILPRMTIVYYWPLKKKYQAGFKTLNEKIEGNLEIIKNGKSL